MKECLRFVVTKLHLKFSENLNGTLNHPNYRQFIRLCSDSRLFNIIFHGIKCHLRQYCRCCYSWALDAPSNEQAAPITMQRLVENAWIYAMDIKAMRICDEQNYGFKTFIFFFVSLEEQFNRIYYWFHFNRIANDNIKLIADTQCIWIFNHSCRPSPIKVDSNFDCLVFFLPFIAFIGNSNLF